MSDTPASNLRGRALVLVAIVLLAANLRPAAVSVGPLLEQITNGLNLSATETSLLTSLPVVAFAIFGGVAPRLAHVLGLHRATLLALVVEVVGLVLRARVHSGWLFLVLTLFTLAGMATANVLMPSLIKRHFPDQIGTMTAVYSTALALGLTAGSVLSVPIADAADSWRVGIGSWAILGVIAIIPWLGLVRGDTPADEGQSGPGIRLGQVARTRIGWIMALAFGLQSLQAYAIFGWFAEVYRGAGFSEHTAGLLLGVITGVSIPLSLLIPGITARTPDARWLVWLLCLLYVVGYVGLIVAPHGGAWLWAVLVGIGTCTFPMVLTMIGLRAHSPEGTAALSGFTQSVGYLISIAGPYAFGALHHATGGWTAPLVFLLIMVIPLIVVALMMCRPQYVEDELPQR